MQVLLLLLLLVGGGGRGCQDFHRMDFDGWMGKVMLLLLLL
jgi:hypothetical protein